MRALWAVVTITVKHFQDDDCMYMAAAIAYYALFSIFPLLLGLMAIAGHFFESGQLQNQVIYMVTQLMPGSGEFMTHNVDRLIETRNTIGVVSVVGLLWSGTALISAVGNSLDKVWRVTTKRPLLKGTLGDLAVMTVIGMVFLVTTSGTPFIYLLRGPFVAQLAFPTGEIVWAIFAALLPTVLTLFVFAVVYRLVPHVRVEWGDVWPGALLAGTLFEIAKHIFSWYVASVANLTLVYGSLAAVMAFLLWAYFSAVILLLGAELVVSYSHMFGSRSRNAASTAVSESA